MPALPQTALTTLPQTALTTPERRLLGLLALGRTSVEAASALHPTPAETEAMLADLLRR